MRAEQKNTHLRYDSISFEEDICIHIFTVSAALVGVCLTVIGIIHVVIAGKNIDTFADDLLSVDAVLFTLACFLSYWAIRSRSIKRMHRVEQVADVVFLTALSILAASCVLITYALI